MSFWISAEVTLSEKNIGSGIPQVEAELKETVELVMVGVLWKKVYSWGLAIASGSVYGRT